MGRNPRTGDHVPVPERKVVTYRPGKKMKEVICTGLNDSGDTGTIQTNF
jgi:nucleoid DNA-binding protein